MILNISLRTDIVACYTDWLVDKLLHKDFIYSQNPRTKVTTAYSLKDVDCIAFCSKAKNWGYEIDDEENLMSTYNPDSKWDWYCEGGRWGAWLLLKEKGEDGEPLNAIFATKEEVDWDAMLEKDRIPFCFVTEDGDWHESASMGWWAMTTNDKDEDVWNKEFKEYLDSVGDDVEISVIDFHI